VEALVNPNPSLERARATRLPETDGGGTYRIGAGTGLHKGDRDYQQDQVAVWPHPRVKHCVLGVVADGMGGRSGGRKASDQVLMTAHQLFERFSPHTDSGPDLLQKLVEEAHMVIRLTAASAEQEPHSTVAAFLVMPDAKCHWIHAGDSRIYHHHRGVLVKRTMDHSYVQSLVDRGVLTPEQAKNHPQSNVLMGCLGTEADPVASVHCIEKMQPGDTLLACSDGVWHYFTDQELGMAAQQLAPKDACETLIRAARERAQGHGDNLSVIVVKFEPVAPPPPRR
jgi:serine/threonine protein phosphatase PrpC